MPVIEDTSQEAALRLQRAAEPLNPPDDRYSIVTGHLTGFLVSDALNTAYEADLALEAPEAPNCRSGSPCYTDLCAAEPEPPTIPPAPVLTAVTPNPIASGPAQTTITVTGTGFKPTSSPAGDGSIIRDGTGSGTPYVTTFVSETELTTTQLTTSAPRTAQIVVRNGQFYASESDPIAVTIT